MEVGLAWNITYIPIYLVSLCDLFGMVSSRDPNSKGMLSDLQRLGIKFGHGLNHLVPGCRCAQIFQHDIFSSRLGQAMMFLWHPFAPLL